jgi:hypothetical protein
MVVSSPATPLAEAPKGLPIDFASVLGGQELTAAELVLHLLEALLEERLQRRE